MAELHKNIQKIYNIPYGKKIYSKKLKNYIEESNKLHNQSLGINPITKEFDREHAIHILKDNYTSLDINHPTNPYYEMVVPFSNYPKSAEGNILFDITNPDIYKAIVPAAIGVGALQENKYGGQWLDKYKEKGEVVNPNNPIQLPNVNFVYKRPVVESTFNPYENVNRVSSNDGTRVYRVNPEQVEKAKKAAAIRNEKIIREYQQNNQSFIGPDNRTKFERDKGIALKKEYDRVMAMQNSDLAKTFASFTPGNNIEAGVMGAETFANLNPVLSGPILATSRLAPAIMHPTNNAYWGPNKSNLENAFGVLGAIGDVSMITPFFKGLPNYKGALEAGKYLTVNKALKNAYNKFKLPGSFNVASVTKNIEKSSFMPKSISELSNTGFRNDPNYHLNAFNDKKKNILKYISTPEGRKRIQNYIDNNPHLKNNTVDSVIESFNKTEFVTETPKYDYTIDNGPNVVKGDWVRDANGNKIYFPVNPDNAFNWYINGYDEPSIISMGQNFTPYDAQHILEHEFAHLFQGGNEIKGVDDELANILLENFNPKSTLFNIDKLKKYNPFKKTYRDKGVSVTADIYGYNNPSNIGLQNQKNYWNTGAGRGQEKAAFAAEVRENLLQRGLIKNRYDEITPELLKKHYDLYKNTIGDKFNIRLYDIMNKNPKNFKYLSTALNKLPGLIPYAIPTAVGVEALNQKQEGGAIITNRGQWDYPGQTTIIPSNKITMEGVPYPVLGVDNTGYVQMMQPQMNYTFPGQYVTEYPMMQYGGLTKYQNKGEVKFNLYENVNRVGTSDNTKVFRLNPEQVEKAKKHLEETKKAKQYVINQTAKAKEFHTKWMHSPMYKEMLKNSAGINAKNINNARLNNLNNIKVSYNPAGMENRPTVSGASFPEAGNVEIYPKGVVDNVNNLGVHEFSHSIDRDPNDFFNRLIPNKDINKMKKYANKEYYNESLFDDLMYRKFGIIDPKRKPYKLKSEQQIFYEDNPEAFIYRIEPTETRARLNDIRQAGWETGAYDPFTEKVNKNIFNKLDEEKFYLENNRNWSPLMQLQEIYTNDQIIDLLNTISKNNNNLNPQIINNNSDWEIIG
jgi:hypothetical protein